MMKPHQKPTCSEAFTGKIDMHDITSIKSMLSDRVQSVAEYLLPGGHKDGSEWRSGSVDGDAGKSLGVHLTGVKAGVWSDFHTGETGDLLDLWMAARRIPLSAALREASDWLGVEPPVPHREPRRNYIRPKRPNCGTPKGRVRSYLTQDRNIPSEILEIYKIGERGDDIVFPFLLPDGELALAKTRKAEDGADPKPTAKNCEPILFGWHTIDPKVREVVLTEGEIDAMSWRAYGWPAMSVPFGGGGGNKQQWIENDFERMSRFERIYIATDMDKAGNEAAVEIANRLGRHRCYRVNMPLKDGNECLKAGISKTDMDDAVASADNLDPEGIRRAGHFTDAVLRLFFPGDGQHVGYRTPYGKLGDRLLFRPSEVTLWSGSSGAGKSQILSDCTVDWIKQGSRICLSSLEMRAEQTLRRMCKQVTGIENPTVKSITSAMNWLDRGLIIYDVVGKASVDNIISIFEFSRSKYGCDQFIIDSLMRLGVASDDYNGQEKAMFMLVDWAISRGIHLHLVAHARKGSAGPKDHDAPETEDVKGTMEIGANAFNIVTVHRRRKLEDAMEKAKDEEELKELMKEPGVILNVAKQRNGDYEGKTGLWFDVGTYRYKSSMDKHTFGRSYNIYDADDT